jgi:hypothetical protein
MTDNIETAQTNKTPRQQSLDVLAIVIIILWLVLLLCICLEVGWNYDKVAAEIGKYVVLAGILLTLQAHLASHHKSMGFLLVLSYVAQFALVSVGICNYLPALKHFFFGKDKQQLTAAIITEVQDSTNVFRMGINEADLYKDCQRVGVQIRDYRGGLLTRFFIKENIPAKDTLQYVASVDSALGNPVSDACRRSNQFAQMLVELSLLIRTKNIIGLDYFFQAYKISPTAKATEIIDGYKVSKGLLKNFLIDVMQRLTPTFTEVLPPGYSGDGTQIIQFTFTTK